jgi:hypothetical protein
MLLSGAELPAPLQYAPVRGNSTQGRRDGVSLNPQTEYVAEV